MRNHGFHTWLAKKILPFLGYIQKCLSRFSKKLPSSTEPKICRRLYSVLHFNRHGLVLSCETLWWCHVAQQRFNWLAEQSSFALSLEGGIGRWLRSYLIRAKVPVLSNTRWVLLGRVRLGSIRNKNNWNNASKRLFGNYSHSGIPGFHSGYSAPRSRIAGIYSGIHSYSGIFSNERALN